MIHKTTFMFKNICKNKIEKITPIYLPLQNNCPENQFEIMNG